MSTANINIITVKNETAGGRVSLRIPALQIDNNYL